MNENLALEKEILEQKRKDILKEVEQKKKYQEEIEQKLKRLKEVIVKKKKIQKRYIIF